MHDEHAALIDELKNPLPMLRITAMGGAVAGFQHQHIDAGQVEAAQIGDLDGFHSCGFDNLQLVSLPRIVISVIVANPCLIASQHQVPHIGGSTPDRINGWAGRDIIDTVEHRSSGSRKLTGCYEYIW